MGTQSIALLALFFFVALIRPTSSVHHHQNELPPDCVEAKLPRVLDLEQFQGEHKERLFWGTYRPQVYLGVRARVKESLIAGLMWFGTEANGTTSLRHICEPSDNLKYGWLRHDGEKYGRQEILDGDTKITTWFAKDRGVHAGYGGDWAVRVKVEDFNGNNTNVVKDTNTTLFFYVGDEVRHPMRVWPVGHRNGGPFVHGKKKEFGHWEVHSHVAEGDVNMESFGFHAANMANLTMQVQQEMRRHDLGNVAVLKITGQRPLVLDFTFVSGESSPKHHRVANLTGDNLTQKLTAQESAFEDRFEDTFKFSTKFTNDDPEDKEKKLEVAKATFSNLVGGIGYFYGRSEVTLTPANQKKYNEPYALYTPASLYTAVPSRPVFPRGFLWDEGFHQLIISKWDRNMSYDILGHWLDLMNQNGWIPREQILGAEARSRVPPQYFQQHPDNGNPPTFFFVFQSFIDSYLNNETQGKQREFDIAFLDRSYPRLSLWYNWFNTSQLGRIPSSYYWHGREPSDSVLNVQTLSSGLDDYPRASHPSADERHLDMRCWMAFASRALSLLSDAIQKPSESYKYTADELSNMDLLNKLHYDPVSRRYYDYGNHTEEVTSAVGSVLGLTKHFQCEMVDTNVTQNGQVTVTQHRVCGTPRLQYVPHFGFVSLFPFMTKIIPAESPILGDYLKFIRDEELLWSGFGLRSLAKTSSMYNRNNSLTSGPYWRGTVWINFNYLALASLKHYATVPGPYQATSETVYNELREGIIKNMVDQYYSTGFIWEQYDNNRNGLGKGAHPFTGWSSLLMLMMAESY